MHITLFNLKIQNLHSSGTSTNLLLSLNNWKHLYTVLNQYCVEFCQISLPLNREPSLYLYILYLKAVFSDNSLACLDTILLGPMFGTEFTSSMIGNSSWNGIKEKMFTKPMYIPEQSCQMKQGHTGLELCRLLWPPCWPAAPPLPAGSYLVSQCWSWN